MSAAEGRQRPVHVIESGPAAGVIADGRARPPHRARRTRSASTWAARRRRHRWSRAAEIQVAGEFEIGGQLSQGSRLNKGSGFLLRVPAIDIAEIGAGGGSIVRVDDAGQLHVGPRSAGAIPGPACYAQGGVDATLTDANVVLGYLDDERLPSGLRLDGELARARPSRIRSPHRSGLDLARRRARRVPARRRADGACGPGRDRRTRPRRRASSRSSPSAATGRCSRPRWRQRSGSGRCSCRRRRACSARSACSRPTSSTTPCGRSCGRSRRRRLPTSTPRSGRSRPRPAACCAGASGRRPARARPGARPALRGPVVRADDPGAERARRRDRRPLDSPAPGASPRSTSASTATRRSSDPIALVNLRLTARRRATSRCRRWRLPAAAPAARAATAGLVRRARTACSRPR